MANSKSPESVRMETPVNTAETPAVSVEFRPNRVLSSPFDGQESKKMIMSPSSQENSTLIVVEDDMNQDGESLGNSNEDTEGQTQSSMNYVVKEGHLNTIAALLKESFKNDIIDSLTTLVKPIVDGVLDGLKQRIDDVEKENTSLREENKDLRGRIEQLESKIDESEQYSRRNCLRVTGMPEIDGEDTDDIIMEIDSAVGFQITKDDIDRSHRVGKRSQNVNDGQRNRDQKTRAIIVKFTSYRARRSFYKARTKLKTNGYPRVYVNEDLTKFRNNLLYKARQLVKSERLNGAWSSDENIVIKKRNNEITRITSDSDLAAFL